MSTIGCIVIGLLAIFLFGPIVAIIFYMAWTFWADTIGAEVRDYQIRRRNRRHSR